ncbi:hypothetical protein GCM10022223_62710 [Kineosporia mesophila]|uniref:NAD glycohydrolase translocation F5/8 type C domain-containing protein n=1 Tax=Kineosporia mesophila TaxID=566012 RepID=A0ABP7AM72_9ACTN|nr:TFIIB-type zinc ribbon-containing protein [Kineosporia mesophila]MCD5354537.1 hypothetical protein [Kineosporia mesophila]
MTCPRCGSACLPADPECPRCGLPFPDAVTPPPEPATVRTTRASERPWIVRGVSVVGALLGAFLVLHFIGPGEAPPATTWRPADLPPTASPSTGTDVPTGVNLAADATITADRTADPSTDDAGHPVSYGTQNLVDGDLTTAWRATGFYYDELITIKLPARSQISVVGLTNGYTKKDAESGADRYEEGRRILSVTWIFDNGVSVNQELEDGDRSIQLKTIEPVQAQTVQLRINEQTTPGFGADDYSAITELVLRAG